MKLADKMVTGRCVDDGYLNWGDGFIIWIYN